MFACEDCTRHFCHGVIVFAHGRDNLADSERIHKLTNAAGVKIDSDPLHAIQVVPGVKFVGNLKNGWQPYANVDMVWNIMDKTDVMANDVRLPQLSVKPYVQYGVGVQKTWGERFTGFFQTMMRNGIEYKTALKNALKGKIVLDSDDTDYPISIALVAHGYDVLDDQASMKIFDKLKKMGVKVYSSLQLTDEQKIEGLNALDQKMYWANELDMTGTAGHYLKVNKIDGLITVNSFGCGPDSLMIEKIVRKAKEYGKPMLSLTIDEHTGEAGFITRLEAFVDMLYRKKRIFMRKSSQEKELSFVPETNICDNIHS